MQPLGNALKPTLREILDSEMSALTTPPQSTALTNSGLPPTSINSVTITSPREASWQTGPLPGERGVVTRLNLPTSPDERAALASQCVATRLPYSLQSYADELERAEEVMASVGFQPPARPTLTAEERQQAREELQTLSLLLGPAHSDPTLATEVFKLFAAFNTFTGDDLKLHAQVEVWADNLEDFPMYAIKRAIKWAIRGEKKLPPLSDFIRDVKLAVGDKVLSRKRMLEQLLNARAM